MKVNNRMLVKLVARPEAYGIQLKKKSGIFDLETKSGLVLPKVNVYNPQDWVPTEGEVIFSCLPDVKKGDHVNVEHFGVIINLGKWWNAGAEFDERNFILGEEKGEKVCKVFIDPKYIYYVENKKGPIRMINDYNIVEPIHKSPSKIILIQTAKTNYANVLIGKYAGKTVVFHNNADMGQIAHRRTVIKSEYIEAVVEKGKIKPLGERMLVKPDKPRALDDKGNVIPVRDRKVSNEGEVMAVGPDCPAKVGDRVVYESKGFTLIQSKERGVELLFPLDRIILINSDMPQPMFDRVLVIPDDPKTMTEAGIIIPPQAIQRPQTGVIMAIGPGYPEKPTTLKEGDRVMFGSYSGLKFEIDGKEVFIMRESEILMTL